MNDLKVQGKKLEWGAGSKEVGKAALKIYNTAKDPAKGIKEAAKELFDIYKKNKDKNPEIVTTILDEVQNIGRNRRKGPEDFEYMYLPTDIKIEFNRLVEASKSPEEVAADRKMIGKLIERIKANPDDWISTLGELRTIFVTGNKAAEGGVNDLKAAFESATDPTTKEAFFTMLCEASKKGFGGEEIKSFIKATYDEALKTSEKYSEALRNYSTDKKAQAFVDNADNENSYRSADIIVRVYNENFGVGGGLQPGLIQGD